MKILEVRDGFILLEADNSIYLSSFIRVTGMDKDYIAQINSMRSVNDIVVATAKILFIMVNDELLNYDKTEPSREAQVVPFTLDILRNSIRINEPVISGRTFDNSGYITLDSKVYDKKILMSIDSVGLNNLITKNLSVQFANLGKNTVIIDSRNVINAKKISAGKDFKLPLNKSVLQFLYKICNDEATSDSRPLIADVFKDLEDYAETVPFVPFGILKSIVDDMVDKQHVFKLFVLKNKLNYLQKTGYFADRKEDIDTINKILECECSIIDISHVLPAIQNCYLEYIYSVLSPEKTQVILQLSNLISKQNLKMIMKESEIPTAIVVNSGYKYLNDIKSLFDNFIIEPNKNNTKIFSVYSSFLSSMEEGTYLITGEGINYIPVISRAQVIKDVIPYKKIENKIPEEDKSIVEQIEQSESETVQDEQNTPLDVVEENIAEESAAEEIVADEIVQEEDAVEEVLEDDVADDDVLEEENVEEVVIKPSQEEIIANIEQKSDEVINSVSENLEDIQEVDLFDSENGDEETESVQEDEIQEEKLSEVVDIQEEEDVQETVIEPEFKEIHEEDDSEEILSEQTEESLSPESEESEDADENEESLNIGQEEIESVESLDDISEENELLPSNGDDELLTDLSETEEEIEILSNDVSEFETEDYSEQEDNEIPEINLVSDNYEQTYDDTSEFQSGDFGETNDYSSDTEIKLKGDISENDFSEEFLDGDSFDSNENNNDEFEEIVELDSDETDANDIVIDLSDEGRDNINIDEDLDRQLVEDVDKVYTTMKESDEVEEISDSDLDLIDELNSDSEEGLLEEYSGLEEGMLDQPSESIIPEKTEQPQNSEILEKRDSSTPIVPVYDADIPQEDLVVSDPIQQGDSVVHAKYGNGIVEKMIKYGTKTLFSINFENIGRRLLDPSLTEIKKL